MIIYNENKENNQRNRYNNHRLLSRPSEHRINDSNIFNVFLIGCCSYIIYSMLVIIPVFADLIFGFVNVYYYDTYNCVTSKNHPFIDITSWIMLNGLLGYLGIVMYINLKYIHLEEGFCNKIVKVSCYVISFFSLVWIILGMISFFKNYYNVEKCIFLYPLLYNYVLIRMILGPIIWITNFSILFKG